MSKQKLPRAPDRTTPGFSFSIVRSALTQCLGGRRFGAQEREEAAASFGTIEPECAFCGSTDVRRWDHLVAVEDGGETLPRNMVPACARCDDSKRGQRHEEWMRGDAPQSPKNRGVPDIESGIERIQAYQAKHDYVVRPLEERLTREELERLDSIRSRLEVLRSDVDDLIVDFRESGIPLV
jgi:hypothetical protein